MAANHRSMMFGAGLALGVLCAGCPERGAAADDPDEHEHEGGAGGGEEVDCGDNGSAHGEHCHCYSGYLFDGTTCVAPAAISEVCEEHGPDEHVDHACLCPTEGPCFCDGTVVTLEGSNYCEPELHG